MKQIGLGIKQCFKTELETGLESAEKSTWYQSFFEEEGIFIRSEKFQNSVISFDSGKNLVET